MDRQDAAVRAAAIRADLEERLWHLADIPLAGIRRMASTIQGKYVSDWLKRWFKERGLDGRTRVWQLVEAAARRELRNRERTLADLRTLLDAAAWSLQINQRQQRSSAAPADRPAARPTRQLQLFSAQEAS